MGDRSTYPMKGDSVECYYTGRLDNGKVFDTNVDDCELIFSLANISMLVFAFNDEGKAFASMFGLMKGRISFNFCSCSFFSSVACHVLWSLCVCVCMMDTVYTGLCKNG